MTGIVQVLVAAILLAVSHSLAEESGCEKGGSDLSVFRRAIESNQWDCASEFVNAAAPGSIEGLKAEYDMLQRKINSKLNDLKSVLESAAPAKHLTPAFEWCQSVDSIFLNVKFAHKLDAPATLNVEASKVAIEDKSLSLEASNGAKHFSLNIPLNQEIIPEESTYDYASVGRMTITLKKKLAPSRWPKLVDKNFNVQQKLGKSVMHFWHAHAEKYSKELDLLDDDDDDEDDKKRKEKAREKLRKEKEKEAKDAKGKEKATNKEELQEAVKSEESVEVSNDGEAPSAFEAASAAATEANEKAEKTEKEDKEERERSRQHVITLATNSERDAITKELTELDAEIKRRKKEIDGRCVEDKLQVEVDVKARKAEIEKGKQSRLDAAEARAKAALDKGEEEK